MARKRAKPSGTSTPSHGADDVHWHSIKGQPSLVYRSGMTDRIAAMLGTGGVAPRTNAPVGRHVRNWRSSSCPTAETAGHFLDWVTFRLACMEAMEPLISTLDSADSFFGVDDYSNDVRDAFLVARILEDHHGFESFDRQQPKSNVRVDLIEARQHLRAVRNWLLRDRQMAGDKQILPAKTAADMPDTNIEVQYVTLGQMAALVQRSKRTLEKWKARRKNPLPPPDIEGAGGRPDEWDWSKVRPWLEQDSKRQLPNRFPSLRPPLTEANRS